MTTKPGEAAEMSEAEYQSHYADDGGKDVAIRDAQPPAEADLIPNKYQGASTMPVPAEEAAILTAPVNPGDVEIRPDGIVYLPGGKYRAILNQAFKPMGWAFVPTSELRKEGDELYREFTLYVHGRFAACAIGQGVYRATNKDMSYGDVIEGVKTNALSRCCKDLGIANELFDPGFINDWIQKYAVQVWRKDKPKPQWRRKDRPKFYDETSPVQAQESKGNSEPKQAATPKQEPQRHPPGDPARNPYQKTHKITKEHQALQSLINSYVKGEQAKGNKDCTFEKVLEACSDFEGFKTTQIEQVSSPKGCIYITGKFHEGLRRKQEAAKKAKEKK